MRDQVRITPKTYRKIKKNELFEIVKTEVEKKDKIIGLDFRHLPDKNWLLSVL